jgi:hypothetical protein
MSGSSRKVALHLNVAIAAPANYVSNTIFFENRFSLYFRLGPDSRK